MLQHAHRIELFFAARATLRVERRLQECQRRYAGNLHWILHGKEHAFGRSLLRSKRNEILAAIENAALRDLVAIAARERIGKRRLARAVWPHECVHFPRADAERESFEDLLPADGNVKILDLEHD